MLAILLTLPMTVLGSESDGKPEASPQPISVNAGDSFELEVPIQAWADSNYTVTFMERTRFSFPGDRSKTHHMAVSDAILFKVPCSVDEDTPDGEYKVAFEISWNVDGTDKKVFGEVEVVVGEGTGDVTCNTMIMLVAPAILAFSLLIVQRRRYP
ncbi:MAG: hypothetical protein JSW25_01265 [Thermoplasmata archaeon]|nr:MAG: hypothetical protein JSW25_01265 [Thermoplasmata archaeon]